MVGSLLRFVEAELTGAGVHIRQQLSPLESKVRVDEGQLRQAFLNLLKNSIQSMPDGGQLTVSTEEAGDAVRIRITDTGKGIDPACMGKIFDPFFTTRDGGTGLGLSLTQQIVSEHGGTIHCESRPGEGTSFVVELPRSH